MPKQTNGAAPTTAPPTLGAVRKRLEAHGYRPVSARWPFGEPVGPQDAPEVFLVAVPVYDISEDPVAVSCEGGLLKLVLQPAEDAVLGERVRAVLDKHQLTGGPVRVGSDDVRIFPLRFDGYDDFLRKDVLDGVVVLERAISYGQYGRRSARIPLDAEWSQGTLLDTPIDKLPQIDDERLGTLLRELEAIPWQLRVERRPPPRPSRLGFIGRSE